MSEELTRFPITPEERHRTARSFDDVQAVPEENLPRQEDHPQDKPLPPTADTADDEDDAANGNAHNDGGRRNVARSSDGSGGDAPAAAATEEGEAIVTDSDDPMEHDPDAGAS